MSYPLPATETRRLQALERYGVLDTPPEEAFDRITRLAARLFEVPIVLVTLVHTHRQWFKSVCGFSARETSRDISFCAHTILTEEVMVVSDATQDARFAENPQVTGDPNIRFYAGAPLMTPDGHKLGTLCIIDRVSRTFGEEQARLLEDLAAMVMDELELRREIAERQRVEAALQESEDKFRSLVEQTNDWIWEIDTEGRFTYVSPGVLNVTGYPPEEVQGRTVSDLMPAAEAERFTSVLERYRPAGFSFDKLEYTLVDRRGSEVVVEISGSPISDGEGGVRGYRGIAHDVTERKQVAEALRLALDRARELNDIKSRFVSMASHELRTPLTAVLLCAEYIEQAITAGRVEEAGRYLHRISRSAQQLAELVDDMLMLGRVEAGQFTFEPASIALYPFVQRLCDDVWAGVGSGHRIALTCSDEDLTVVADRKLLRLLVTNLLSNAMKYSPEGSTVEVGLARSGDTVELTVRDQGIGIPEEEQPRLFEPFYRAENVGEARGTGLGLFIAKQAVDLHSGEILVQSTAGEGTIFFVMLPLAQHSAPPPVHLGVGEDTVDRGP